MPGPSIDTSRLKELPAKFGAAARNNSKRKNQGRIMRELFDALLEKQQRREHDKQREEELAGDREHQFKILEQQSADRVREDKIKKEAEVTERQANVIMAKTIHGQKVTKASELYTQGTEAFANGDHGTAIRSLGKALTTFGDVPDEELKLIGGVTPELIKSTLSKVIDDRGDSEKNAMRLELQGLKASQQKPADIKAMNDMAVERIAIATIKEIGLAQQQGAKPQELISIMTDTELQTPEILQSETWRQWRTSLKDQAASEDKEGSGGISPGEFKALYGEGGPLEGLAPFPETRKGLSPMALGMVEMGYLKNDFTKADSAIVSYPPMELIGSKDGHNIIARAEVLMETKYGDDEVGVAKAYREAGETSKKQSASDVLVNGKDEDIEEKKTSVDITRPDELYVELQATAETKNMSIDQMMTSKVMEEFYVGEYGRDMWNMLKMLYRRDKNQRESYRPTGTARPMVQ